MFGYVNYTFVYSLNFYYLIKQYKLFKYKMFDNKFLTNFEKLLIEDNKVFLKKDFIKSHYKTILQMANPLIVDKKIIVNEYQLKLMCHLFKISCHVEYIPSL